MSVTGHGLSSFPLLPVDYSYTHHEKPYSLQRDACLQIAFTIEEEKTIVREVIKHIPNSSSIACVINCKQDPACKTSGISKNNECYLFGEKKPKEDDVGVTLSLFKHKQVLGPDDKGMAFDLYQKYGMNSNSST